MRSVATALDEQALVTLLKELGESARRFRFGVAPNPCVGAAVLAGTREVGRGFHRVFGEEHAEIAALAAAEGSGIPRSEWDVLVVTLEPCSSTAKTPPCVDAILAAGIKTVIAGALDPDLRHRGRGLEALRDAGVEVILLEGIAGLEWVAPYFLDWCSHERLRRPRPWTIAKWAQTLSGHLSPPLPRSMDSVPDPRISGPEAHAEVQHLRSRVDAIMTGVGTILADDPLLTVRPPGRAAKAPMRVVLDSYLRTRPSGRMFTQEPGPEDSAGQVHVLSFAGADGARARALQAAGAEIHGLHGSARDSLDLRDVLEWLWEQGARRVLLETGPTLLQAMLEAGFVDQVRIYTSDVRGGEGNSLAGWLHAAKLRERADSSAG
ncbi:MAG: diaminohydroxyphosphoribosylaminopyrimidine deaminase, partial [Chlamydiales bacterium]